MSAPVQTPAALLAKRLDDAIWWALRDSFAEVGGAAGLDPRTIMWAVDSWGRHDDPAVLDAVTVRGTADDEQVAAQWAELLDLAERGAGLSGRPSWSGAIRTEHREWRICIRASAMAYL